MPIVSQSVAASYSQGPTLPLHRVVVLLAATAGTTESANSPHDRHPYHSFVDYERARKGYLANDVGIRAIAPCSGSKLEAKLVSILNRPDTPRPLQRYLINLSY